MWKYKDNLSGVSGGKCSVRNHTCSSARHTFHTSDKKLERRARRDADAQSGSPYSNTKRNALESRIVRVPHRPQTNCSPPHWCIVGGASIRTNNTSIPHDLTQSPKIAAPFTNELCKALTYSLNWSNTFSHCSEHSAKSLWINYCVFLSFKQLRHHWNRFTRVNYSSSLTLTYTVYVHIHTQTHTELLAGIKLLNDDHMSQYSYFCYILIKHTVKKKLGKLKILRLPASADFWVFSTSCFKFIQQKVEKFPKK